MNGVASSERVRRLAMISLVAALSLFACAALRVAALGQEHLEASDQAFHAGQLALSVRHAERAATLYVPGASHVRAAHARLTAIAQGAERARDLTLARSAWQAMRSAAFASRHAWMPGGAEFAGATRQLERSGAGAATTASPPVAAWGPLAGLGFLALVVGAFGAVRTGLTSEGKWVPAGLAWSGLAVFLGLLCFGLAFAGA